jgi:seryl-tRNA synthetase
MAVITYALLSSQTLKLDVVKRLKIAPMEIEIELKGGFTDPSSLQIIRDAAAPVFKAHRDKLNDQVARLDAALAAESHPGKVKGLVDQFNSQIPAIAKKLEAATRKNVEATIETMAEGARAIEAKRVAFTVGFVWSALKLGKTALEYYAGGDDEEAANHLAIAKDVYDSLKLLIKAVASLRDYIASESDVRAQIEDSRRRIKAAKGQPVQSLVDRLEMQLKSYAVKIAHLEKEARGVARELDSMLKQADKGGKGLKKKLAPPIDQAITQVIAINEGVSAAQKYLKSSTDALKDARKKAVDDPRTLGSLLQALDDLYEKVCGFFDKAEAQLGNFEKAAEMQVDEIVEALQED